MQFILHIAKLTNYEMSKRKHGRKDKLPIDLDETSAPIGAWKRNLPPF